MFGILYAEVEVIILFGIIYFKVYTCPICRHLFLFFLWDRQKFFDHSVSSLVPKTTKLTTAGFMPFGAPTILSLTVSQEIASKVR